MERGTNQRLRIAVLLVLGAAYALAAHWFTSRSGLAEYGAILSVAPWLAVGLVLAWQSKQRGLMIAGCLTALAVLYLERDALLENFTWVYFIQHAGSFAALAIAFGRTLGRGIEPMCSRFARTVHGTLTDDVSRYTRHITLAWTAFFVVLCLTSAGLFALAPLPVWSLFANLLTPILVGAMFGAEYLVRLRALPRFEHVGLVESVRSIWASSSAGAASSDSR
jgi:uncharacterized membrane protein